MRNMLAAGLVALLVAVVLFWLARGVERPGASRPPPDPAPAVDEAAPIVPASAASPPGAARETAALASDAPPAPVRPAEAVAPGGGASGALLRVRARLVDERGGALTSGRLELRLDRERAEAVAGAAGEVDLAVERARLRSGRTLHFDAFAPARTRKLVQVDWELVDGRAELFLGEIALAPGGSLAGRVIDESGAPVAAASVTARPPRPAASESERAAARVWLPWRSFPGSPFLSASTAADGSYRVEGAPCGLAEVLASDGERLVACSGELEVRAGEETRVPDLVLRAADDADRIAGVVRATDRQPFAGAMVRLLDAGEDRGFGAEVRSDAEGRFEMLAARDLTYTVIAYDPSNMRPVRCRDVRAGDLALELRFGASGSIDLSVSDDAGPVAEFRAGTEDAEGRGLAGHAADASGRVRLDVPEVTFRVWVMAPRHRLRTFGPFEPGSAPSSLEVVLERAGGIAGVVLVGGVPVPGAAVHAHHPTREGAFGLLTQGFVTFVAAELRPEARTDDAGRFFLPLLESGRYRLHATASGHARGATTWLVFDGQRLDGVEIALPRAGAIAGRLLVALGADALGTWIGATDGEGHAQVAQTDAAGDFGFSNVAPGRWQVQRLQPGQERNLAGNDRYRPPRESDEPRWDVEVVAGRTARFDINVRDELPCVLEGHLTLGAVAPRGWSPYFEGTAVALDADGRFVVRARKAGVYRLGFRGPAGAYFSFEVELAPGANAWTRDVPVAELLLENLPAVPDVPEHLRGEAIDWPEFELAWSEGKSRWSVMLQASPSASVRVEHVPAGALVLRARAEDSHPDHHASWPVLAQLELAGGEFKTLRLP